MTNEEMAIAIYEGQNHLLKDLYLNNSGIIYKCAVSFFNRNSDRCMQCGVEVSDMMNEAYFALPEAVTAYNQSDKQYKFITFLRFPLLNCFSVLAGLRTKTERKEPLNLSTSLDAPLSDADDLTLGDTIEDITTAEICENIENFDYFNILYEELKKLSEKEQEVVFRHYLNNETLTSIAQSKNVYINAVRQHKVKALRKLRKSEKLKNTYYSDFSYHCVSYKEFNRTWTSSTEKAVLFAMGELNKERGDMFE